MRLGRGGWGVGGDSSVIELRWKDLIRSLSFVFPCFRIYSPSTFTNTYRHIHISTRDTCGGGGRSGQGGFGVDNSVIKELQRTLIIYAHSCSILTLPFVRLPLVEPL